MFSQKALERVVLIDKKAGNAIAILQNKKTDE